MSAQSFIFSRTRRVPRSPRLRRRRDQRSSIARSAIRIVHRRFQVSGCDAQRWVCIATTSRRKSVSHSQFVRYRHADSWPAPNFAHTRGSRFALSVFVSIDALSLINNFFFSPYPRRWSGWMMHDTSFTSIQARISYRAGVRFEKKNVRFVLRVTR